MHNQDWDTHSFLTSAESEPMFLAPSFAESKRARERKERKEKIEDVCFFLIAMILVIIMTIATIQFITGF